MENNENVKQKSVSQTRYQEILEAISNFPKRLGTPNLMGHVIPREKTVFILPVDMSSEKTAAGIYIPDTAKEDLCIGAVVAVGPGVSEDIEVGHLVGYNRFANMDVIVEGQRYLRMHDNDIYYFINPEGSIVHVDKASQIKKKEDELQEGRKENARVVSHIDSEHANKVDKIREQRKKKWN